VKIIITVEAIFPKARQGWHICRNPKPMNVPSSVQERQGGRPQGLPPCRVIVDFGQG
jgi:hypothetical protein